MPILNTFTSAAARAFKSVVSSVIDPFFSSVGLLLHGDLFGTTNQNNTFLDSSSLALSPVAFGAPAQGSFTPYSTAGGYNPTTQGGSCYFNGTNNYLALPSTAGNLSGDFTIEFWMYGFPNGTYIAPVGTQSIAGASTAGMWRILTRFNSTNAIYFARTSGTGFEDYNFGSVNVNDSQWHHIAFCRLNNILSAYIDGVFLSSRTISQSLISNQNLNIGFNAQDSAYYSGYLSNVRIVNGTAVYTTNFTPPTSLVSNIPGTILLLNFANAAAYDASAKTNLATFVNAAVSSVQKKFGTGSLFLNGASYFQYIDQTPTLIGTGNFTIECWFYQTSNASTSRLFTLSSSVFIQDSSAGFKLFWTPTSTELISVSRPSLNTWTHLAIVRQATTFYVFVNGVLSGATTSSLSSATAGIGYIGASGVPSEFFNGYIDEFRLTKGVARYTTSFTVPDAPYPNS
jgi:hypothetical protein